MPFQGPPEPPTQEDLEQQLRRTLAQLDSERGAAVAAADEHLSQLGSALATAGSEYNDQIAGAQQNYSDAQDDYDAFLTNTSAKLSAAQAAIDAIDPTPPSIDATITPITVPTGGTPDCAALDIEGAVNAGFAQVQTVLEAIIDALDNGNIDNAKQALQALKDTGQAFRDPMPGAADLEAEKTAKYSELDGLYP